jgi:DNA-directed RNA polymerase subunit M/transcription elongation factor TFIIS
VVSIDFCPRCGALLQVVKKGSPSLRCPKCKYQKPLKQEEVKQKIKVQNGKALEIAVVGKKEEVLLRSLPTVNVVCQECGYTLSEVWNVEAANENTHSTITFFRCTKCKATRRESG